MADDLSDLLNEVLASPLGDVIASVGAGVAEAQQALDEASLAKTLEIYREGGDDLLRVLREIGYRPTFYALPETTGEVNVSMRLSGSGARETSARETSASPGNPLLAASPSLAALRARAVQVARPIRAYVTPVDAAFQNRYTYQAEASAKLTFKIVPVPAPAGVDDLRVVPNLAGSTVQLAQSVLDALDIGVKFVDKDGEELAAPNPGLLIESQSPPEGSVIQVATILELRISGA